MIHTDTDTDTDFAIPIPIPIPGIGGTLINMLWYSFSSSVVNPEILKEKVYTALHCI